MPQEIAGVNYKKTISPLNHINISADWGNLLIFKQLCSSLYIYWPKNKILWYIGWSLPTRYKKKKIKEEK